MTETFNAHAESYERDCMRGLSLSGEGRDYFCQGRLAYLEGWLERSARPRPRRIVDLGCGDGQGTHSLAETFPEAEVRGIDQAEQAIARAQAISRPGLSFSIDLQASRGWADLVHLNGVVHHVEPRDRPLFFEQLRSLLAPGGLAAVFENNPLNPGTRLVMSRIPFDRDAHPLPWWQLRRHLRGAGLNTVHKRHLFYFPRALAFLRRLERPLGRLPLGAQYALFAEAR